jgi:hypothetical protein
MDLYDPQASLLETERAHRTTLNVCFVFIINIAVLCFIVFGLLRAEKLF